MATDFPQHHNTTSGTFVTFVAHVTATISSAYDNFTGTVFDSLQRWRDALQREARALVDPPALLRQYYPRFTYRLPKAKDVVVLRPVVRRVAGLQAKLLSWLNCLHNRGVEASS